MIYSNDEMELSLLRVDGGIKDKLSGKRKKEFCLRRRFNEEIKKN